MSVIIFLVVLAVLILVHELGHFLAAKSADVRVDEFGLGFPPKVVSWKPRESETTYSLNWIPFGGFVKIFGEDGETDAQDSRSMQSKGAFTKIWILAAGVIFNFLFAWVLVSLSFMTGLPTSVTPDTAGVIGTPITTIIEVMPDSVASLAGLKPGDEIVYLELPQSTDRLEAPTVEEVQTFIAARAGEPFTLGYERNEGEVTTIELVPSENPETGRGMIGVGLDMIGLVKLAPHVAIAEGLRTTIQFTGAIAVGLVGFIADAFTGSADFSQVAGPVGIAGLVGDAASRGVVALLSFTALISLNLAVLNLLPFPALDGGRILFVIIEAIKGSAIKAKTAQIVNTVGFGLLILLMLVVTVSDVVKLFGN